MTHPRSTGPGVSRRRFLQAGSALIALPWLSLGAGATLSAAEPLPTGPRKRLIFLGFGWGVTEESWYPKVADQGPGYALPPGLQPLARHKADFTIVQNLTHRFATNGHYGGTFWLTGANEFGEPGQGFHTSISADQAAAAHLGGDVRFDSLALDCGDTAGRSGHGPGLSLSWDARGKPVGGPRNPLEAFHRLFSRDGAPIAQRKLALAQRRSVMDRALAEARDLQRDLGKTDNGKLDEYLQGIRDIETRLGREEKWLAVPQPDAPLREPPADASGHDEIELMYEIMVAALQTDSTRVMTYRQPTHTLVASLGITMDSHTMSHYHGPRGEKLEASQRRDLAQSELLAGLLDRLKAVQGADGSRLLDHTTVVYGSNIRTGHSVDNRPTIIAGRGAGLKMGQHLVAPKDTPLCNAWLTVLRGPGAAVERHGDGTGVIKELIACTGGPQAPSPNPTCRAARWPDRSLRWSERRPVRGCAGP